MLKLTRRVGQSIHIGDDIIVKVTGIDRGNVHLCFDAPKEVKILRDEVRTRIQQAEQEKQDGQEESSANGNRGSAGDAGQVPA